MELKLVKECILLSLFIVLIVPYVIEIYTPVFGSMANTVLIVPYGIEMYILIVILVKHCRVLIVPYGIEIK